MMESDAYRGLSLTSRCLWAEIIKRHNGFNNGDIAMSCREAAILLGVGKNTAAKSFDQLVEHGLLKITKSAGFNQKSGRRSRRWRLTHHADQFNKKPTDEWKDWSANLERLAASKK
jgi:predicted ArsR family transcriptional regulator